VLPVLGEIVKDARVEALQADQALGTEQLGDMIRSDGGVRVPDHEQSVVRGIRKQPDRGLKHEHAC
jgi:hypothetical protein